MINQNILEKTISKSKIKKVNDSMIVLSKKDFLKLPVEERNKVLKMQAMKMIKHYKNENEWKEFQALDFYDY